MIKRLNLLIDLFIIAVASLCHAQNQQQEKIYLVPMCVYEGDTIPCVQLREVLIFKPFKFKNEKERK